MFDGDEIQVPQTIQDLIERNIRTMSNSLSAVNSNVAKSGKADYNVEEVQKLHIKALNKLLTSEDENDDNSALICQRVTTLSGMGNLQEELKDSWYTKEELKQQRETQEL